MSCVLALSAALTACSGARNTEGPQQRSQAGGGAECPTRVRAKNPLPGVQPAETTLQYWLQRYSNGELDEVLMNADQVAAYNARVGRRPGRQAYSQRDLRVPVDALELAEDVRERLAHLRPQVEQGKLVAVDGQPLSAAAKALFAEPMKLQSAGLRAVLTDSALRCGPYDGPLYKEEVQRAYDRNACGVLHAQEPIELLGKTSTGTWLARSRYSLGFLPAATPLSAPIPATYQQAFLHGPRVRIQQPSQLTAAGGAELPEQTSLPLLSSGELLAAGPQGVARMPRSVSVRAQGEPLTRRAVLSAAFAAFDKPYGLGGAEGGYDCSSLLLELFERFDVALPRFSGWQAEGGSYAVDLRGAATSEKLRRLDLAAKSGIVLLHFPGHIMLYLGRSSSGTPFALHALGDYLEACEAGETLVDVQRVVVSTLELGRNTSRTSFLERMTRLVVFGGEAPSELRAHLLKGPAAPPAKPGSGESCQDGTDTHIFISPAVPEAGKPLRAIAAGWNAPGDATLQLFESDGDAAPLDEFGLGGPPFARVARIAKARSGQYTAVLGSGGKQLACRKIRVREASNGKSAASEGDPVWEPRLRWDRDNEALFAIFVEQLFTGPPDDEQTWTNLHSLLRDPSRNLLLDHLGMDEDNKLEIEPDCADLPYSLRAYFAWKLRLPYAFRICTRGKSGQPPNCGGLRASLMPRKAADDVAAFSEFVNHGVRPGVHSATGRTHPSDSETDLYPVPLERSALPPGTVYADPYGHVMMVSKWFAEGTVRGSPYGVLMAAEAQPDGTIGRRRFWQGSFLFDPDTTNVGAGFKRFRPLSYERTTQELTALDNAKLANSKEFARYSQEQYTGKREDFYDRMDTLINPAPLAPRERMLSLVDALEEAARRRVLSVDNGEHYAKDHPQVVISMPQGHEIFETEGAWEDFATPSRDMRLLIAIDTVTALPEQVEQKPSRFALPEGTSAQAAAQELRANLDKELRARTFQYTRSDGSPQTLSLADVVARAAAFELAYNPNDCAEVRWGAPAGSAERTTCKRSAPQAQQNKMQNYRAWFRARTRPARGE